MSRETGLEIRVTGLRETRDALRAVDRQLANQLRGKLLKIANSVAQDIRPKVPALTGAARKSVKAKASQLSASIAWGSDSVPYFAWLDFGGSVGRGHQPGKAWSGATRREWRGMPGAGRYVYPTIYEHRAQSEQMLGEAIEELSRKAGFEVKG